MLRELWARMAALYPWRWTRAMGQSPEDEQGDVRIAGEEWMRELAGLTKRQIETGLDACRAAMDEWPPSAPAFRKRCLSIPAIDVVRDEIKTREYSRFTRQVLAFLDWHGYQTRDGKAAEKLLQSAFQRACDHVMRGGSLPEEPVALVEQQVREFKPADPAVVAAAMAEMARRLGVGPAVGRGSEP